MQRQIKVDKSALTTFHVIELKKLVALRNE